MRNLLFVSNTKNISDGGIHLTRPYLTSLLEKAAERPLVTVVAGAGYGKTRAVHAFLRDYRAFKLWIQLTDQDNTDDKFWENFTNAIAKRSEAFASKLRSIGFPETRRQFDRLFTLMRDEITPGLKVVIVYDDFHLITSKSVKRLIEETVAERVGDMATILISRTQPDIGPMSMLSKGLLAQINEEHLRFSRDEIDRYFKLLGVTLPSAAVADIEIGTEGWAFAVALIGLSLENGVWRREYALSAMKANVFKLIDTEVFSPASADMRRFLVKLSLINHLSPALLRELCDDKPLIDELRKLSSFIRFDEYSGVYRVHHLFLEYLRQKQDLLSEDDKRGIYIKAAKWCADTGGSLDAIAYYEKAGDYAGVAKTAYTLMRMTPSRVAKLLLKTLGRLPERAYRENTELYIIKIKLLQSLALFDDAEALARSTLAEFERMPDTPENCWVLSECYLNLGYIGIFTALYTGVCDYTHYFERGYHFFEKSRDLDKGPRERAIVSSYVSRVGYPAARGELQRRADVFAGYVDYAIAAKRGMMRGMVDLAECEAAYFKADMKKAEGMAYQAAAKAREAEQFQIENRALFFLLRINIYTGGAERLRGVLAQLRAQLDNSEFFDGYTLCDIVCGWFFAHIRQIDRVANWLKSDFEKSELNTLLYGLEKLVQAKCLMVEKKYYAALAALEGQDGMYGVESFLLGKLEVSALRSVCKYNAGDKSGALQELARAYEISLSDDLDMPFIELGRDMRTLTAAAMRDGACKIPAQWLGRIHKKSSAYAKTLSYIITEYRNYYQMDEKLFVLTAKEKEILTDMCRGLSRTEIAYNRNVSVNTVKLLIQNIYSKLGAQNTADAVWIAAKLKLVE